MVLVSVIVPAWRAEAFIGRALESARGQTLSDIEIIVVDDCSPDGTVNAVERVARNDPRVRLVKLSGNRGPAGARNAGLEIARGEWVAPLDADDEMAPERLETLLGVAAGEKADIICDAMWITPDLNACAGEPFLQIADRATRALDLAAFADGNHLFKGRRQSGYLKPMLRRAVLSEGAISYDERVRIGEDYLLVAEALARGARYVVYGAPLYRYLVRPGSVSRAMSAADARALLDADDRFMARFASRLDERSLGALARRRDSLEDAWAFINMIEALKAGRYAAVARAALRRPGALRHFEMPLRKRLAIAGLIAKEAP